MDLLLISLASISVLACLGLAGFALSRRVSSVVNLSFAAGLASMGIIQAVYTLATMSATPEGALFWVKTAVPLEALALAAFVLFSITFSRATEPTSPKVWGPAVGCFLLGAGLIWFLPSESFFYSVTELQFAAGIIHLGRAGYAFYIFLLLGLVYCAANLEVTLRSSSGTDRWRMKFLVLGIEGLLAYTIFQTSQWLVFHEVRLNFILLRAPVLLVSSGFMAFGIVRHRLLDTRVRVSRHIIYQSLTVLLVGVYLLMVGLLAGAFQYLGVGPQYFFAVLVIFLSAMGLATLLLSDKLRSRVRRYISTHFFRNKYDYRVEWLRVTEELASKITLRDLIEPILDLFTSTVEVARISLWIWEPARRSFILRGGRNVPTESASLPEGNSLVAALRANGSLLSWEQGRGDDELTKTAWDENQELCKKLGAEVWMPLKAGEEIVGLVSLGPMISGDAYTDEDYDLLKTMGRQAGAVILNALLSEAMVENKEMEAFHKLSSFVLHDLKNFTSSLSMVVQNAAKHLDNPEYQRETFRSLEKTARNMSALIARLSSGQPDFDLEREETDLNTLAEEALAELRNGANDLELSADLGPLPPVKVDRHQVEKVIRNLFLNAVEAVGAKGSISISTWVEDGWANLAVADDGPGMESEFIENRLFRPFQTTKGKGLGLGLYHCKAIMEAHGGQIEVHSEVNKGTTFTLRFAR